ncbi:MAG: protein phosphatase 2C domain-containing protein [Sulfuricellaceae bacterium]|nr:protein phosphatase 2C domain-containing protein [Sulfuricellaceae bacterium]
MKWKINGLSDIGRVRAGNEDSILWDEPLGFVLLADGMGGHEGGEIASRIAVQSTMEHFKKPLENHWRELEWTRNISDNVLKLYAAVSHANQAVYEMAQEHPELEGMGTTLLAAHFHGNRATLAHIGDSRIYLWRNEKLTQLTVDHTLEQQQLKSDEPLPILADNPAMHGILTRALGVDPVVEVDMREVGLADGDLILLCSDGCYDMLPADEMPMTLKQHQNDPEALAQQLIRHANDNGGYDNLSVITIKIQAE